MPHGHSRRSVFARWRQCAVAAFGPLECTSHNPNGKSIGSAILAQITAKCRPAHWRHLANTTELVLPSAHLNPQPKRQIDQNLAVFAQLMAEVPILYNGRPFRPNCPFYGGDLDPPSNTWFLPPVLNPNGISIGLAIFAGLTSVTD